jgi:hypothetical protein
VEKRPGGVQEESTTSGSKKSRGMLKGNTCSTSVGTGANLIRPLVRKEEDTWLDGESTCVEGWTKSRGGRVAGLVRPR